MATTHFLLQSNFNSNSLLHKSFHLPSFSRSFPTKSPYAHNIALKKNYSSYKAISVSPKFRTKCFIIDHNPDDEKGFGGNRGGEDHDLKKVAVDSGMNGETRRLMDDVVKALQIPVVTGILLGLWLLYDHHHFRLALAASGGRMGGRSFSSRSSSRSTRSSSSSRSSSSPSYSSSGSYSSWASIPSSSSSSDETYRTHTSSPVHVKSATEPGLGYYVVVVLFFAMFVCGCFTESPAGPNTIKTSVLKLQVGLLGTGRSLQGDLNKIAEAADTSTSKGLSYVLQEAILALLRHPDYCISGYSSVDVKRNKHEGEKLFDQFSIEERGKFDEETLVNVNNIKRRSPTSHNSNGLRNEYTVVTIIVAASGVLELPPIKSSAQLKKALQKLASIPSSNLMAAEVLWTPQKEDDCLTEQEYRQDYPLLHPL